MEEENKIVTPQEDKAEERVETKVEEKSSSAWIVVLNVFLALVTILLLAYIAYRNGYINLDNVLNLKQTEDSSEEQSNEESQDQGEDSEESMEVFEGEYLSAIVPEGWSIEEYEDGDGTEMLVDGVTYTGLTGIKIFKGEDEIMMFGAVSGIGFVGCGQLALFNDSSTEYNEEQADMNQEVGMEFNTVDYTDTNYSDFEFLGKSMRRVSTDLYYDTVEGNEYFEPQCEKGLMTLNGVSFLDSGEYEGTSYYYKITEGTSALDLDILDGILASMTAE